MRSAIHFSSAEQVVGTPDPLFAWLDASFGFTLDVCAVAKNAKCPRFFSPSDNGLAQDWTGDVCWMNPPYDNKWDWMKKARWDATKGASVVALVPARPDGWWIDTVEAPAGKLRASHWEPLSRVLWMRWERLTVGVHHLDGRVPFDGHAGSAPFPSAVVVFDPPRLSSARRRRPVLVSGQPYPLTWGRP